MLSGPCLAETEGGFAPVMLCRCRGIWNVARLRARRHLAPSPTFLVWREVEVDFVSMVRLQTFADIAECSVDLSGPVGAKLETESSLGSRSLNRLNDSLLLIDVDDTLNVVRKFEIEERIAHRWPSRLASESSSLMASSHSTKSQGVSSAISSACRDSSFHRATISIRKSSCASK